MNHPTGLTNFFKSWGLCAALIATLLLFAPTAQADISFGPEGPGAGQLRIPSAIAVDDATGEVFVTERANNRVSVFNEEGDFLRAFGWGVDTGANALEVCTTASTCQAGISGAAGGQLSGPRSIAVDNDPLSPAFGDIYVSEGSSGDGNARVQRFTAAGAFVLAFGDGVNVSTGGDVCTAASGNICGPGTAGAGAGQFVPNTDNANNAPRLAFGSGGTVHVADYIKPGGSRLQRFDSSGAFLSQLASLPGSSGADATLGLAVEPDGDFYLTTNVGGGIRKYDSAGSLLQTLDGFGALALDPSGNLYARNGFSTSFGSLNLYDPSGALLSVTYGEQSHSMDAVAARATANGDFYVLDPQGANKIAHIRFEPPGPVVLPRAAQVGDSPSTVNEADTKATPVGNLTATLHTRVNPEGRSTTVHFEYVDDAEYQANGFANAIRTAESAPIGSDFESHTETFGIACPGPGQPGCLIPDTVYRLRAVAVNADGTDTGPVASFKTLPPIALGEVFAIEVSTETATLHGALNPNGIPTTARFQYVTEAEFQANGFANAEEIPDSGAGAPPLDYGSGSAELSRSVLLSGLAPDTAYRYRYLATDFYGNFPGPEGRFHTFALPDPLNTDCPNQAFRADLPSAHLPHCRAYEMVSPPQKGGGDLLPDEDTLALTDVSGINKVVFQATSAGEGLTYTSPQKFADPDGAPWLNQYIATRNPVSGWQNDNVSPPRQTPPFYPAVITSSSQTTSFNADLCTSFVLQDNDRALAAGDNIGYPDLYRRHNCGPGAGSYDLLTIRAPETIEPGIVVPPYTPRVQGFSADGSLVVFRANDRLTTDASHATADNDTGAEGPAFQLYIHNGTTLRLVSVLPSPGGTTLGAAADSSSSLGSFNQTTQHQPSLLARHRGKHGLCGRQPRLLGGLRRNGRELQRQQALRPRQPDDRAEPGLRRRLHETRARLHLPGL